MARMREVQIFAKPLALFDPLLSEEAKGELASWMEETRRRMTGRVLWNVNSTGSSLGPDERALYEDVAWDNAGE